jgi:hypothetical protein
VCYLRYTQVGDGIKSVDTGAELLSITGTSKLIDNQSTYVPPSGACSTPSTVVVDKTFDVLVGFYQDIDTFEIGGGGVRNATTGSPYYRLLRSSSSIGVECQWADTITIATPVVGQTYSLALRHATGNSGNYYVVQLYRYSETITRLSVKVYNGSTLIESLKETNEASLTYTEIAAITTPTRLVAQVSGINNDTTFSVWLGKTGTGPSDLGTPDYTFTSDPTNPCNTGTNIGIVSQHTAGTYVTYPYFKGGAAE